jgi:DNA-directed RNA polymerase II subunit RPB2
MTSFKEKHIWKVLEAYFKENSIVKNQIDSFNHFIDFGLQEIVEQESELVIQNYSIHFENIYIEKPQVIESDRSLKPLYPHDCRLRELNYDASIYCDFTEIYIEGGKKEEKTHYRVSIGRMPIMLLSNYCNLSKLPKEKRPLKGECVNDPGGYFIIKGNERVLVGQMRAVYNQPFVLKSKKPGEKYVVEARSISDETGHSVLVQGILTSEDHILLSLPYIKSPVPCGVVFKAMGFLEEEEIIQFLSFDSEKARRYIRNIIRDSFFCDTVEKAQEYISKFAMHIITDKRGKEYAKQIVEVEILPHMGISGTTKEQACFLGRMIKKLVMTFLGERAEDDRDNYTNKRVDNAGSLMYDIFRNLFKKFKQTIKDNLETKKHKVDIISLISRIRLISQGLHKCLATGNWGVQKNATYMKTGVSQILDRMTYLSSLSHLRRLVIPVGKEGKNTAMRQLHSSSFGFVCPCETPEGQKIGIVLNYSLTTKITCRGSKVENRKVLEKAKTILKTDEIKDLRELAFVFLNGNVIGFSKDPEDTVNEIKKMRQKGLLDSEVSVSYDIVDNDIKIFCDEGRFTRPLFVLENNTLKIKGEDKYKWKNLLKEDVVRYVDASEIEQSVIAMNTDSLKIQENDFSEIHPMLMLGIMASMIPFPDHSQSPRNCYQSSMGKQALGVPVLSYNIRTDTLLHVLHYPQKPLVYTKASELLHINDMPSGINAIVAIACYSGFNQEDSVMLNLSSIQRGLFSLTSYHTIDCMEKKRDTYSFEEIRLPPENSGPEVKETEPKFFRRKKANYSLLDENGIVKPREKGNRGNATKVKKGDVIVGKVVVVGNKSGSEKLEDQSIIIQPGEEGIIDRVYTTVTPNGYKLVKVVIRVNRIPELGDKFASRAAQKGTLGMVYRQEDMPYTASGIVPDIIINPLCLAGDSEICLDGSVDTIENIVNSEDAIVKTVDPKTFSETYTGIHSPFKIVPTRPMVRVKTWSGREIVCTDDHMVLTDSNEWKQAKELIPNRDMLTVVHTVKKLDTQGDIPELKISETHLYYSILKDFVITEPKLQILARLLGAIETDGHLEIRNSFSESVRAVFNLGEEKDVEDIEKDVLKLGFKKPVSKRVSTKMNGEVYMTTFRVEIPPSLGYVLYKLGAHPGRKSVSEKVFPEWLTKASKEVKRQFLSGIQGGDGSYLSVNTKTVQQQVRMKPTKMTCRVSVEKYHIEYMKGIVDLFRDLGISSTIRNTQPKDKLSREISVAVSCRNENLERYSDYIYYAYSNHKEIRSRIGIEFLRLRNRGIKIPYQKMAEFWKRDCVSVYVDSVKSEPLHTFVYDFATKADTHSFIANSIVVHNCIPSRMTINQLIECVLGKEACFTKKGYADATPFTKASENVATKLVDRIRDTLPSYGFSPHGWERMYNGMTGEMMEANIFIGPTYYQRLKHMVNDKMHARAKGHVTILTRQPLEGRARDGGFRFGEMERDCMIGHGCARFTKERLHDVSDPFQIPVCKNCKVITNTPKECQICKTDKVYYCTFPYASKLLHQELTSMGLKIKIKPDTITDEE